MTLAHRPEIELASSRIKYSPMGLEIPGDLTYEEWEVATNTLKGMQKAIRWWWGDLIGFGEARYGEQYTQALNETGMDYGSLADSVWVSKQIESSRRRELLSWSHHREVAKLKPAEQDRWLAIAEEERIGHKDLRERMKGDGEVLKMPKLYQCPDCGFTAQREGFKEVSK